MTTASPQTAHRVLANRKPRLSFMAAGEAACLRLLDIRATQERLAEQMIDPRSGEPVTREDALLDPP